MRKWCRIWHFTMLYLLKIIKYFPFLFVFFKLYDYIIITIMINI